MSVCRRKLMQDVLSGHKRAAVARGTYCIVKRKSHLARQLPYKLPSLTLCFHPY